MAQPLPPLAIIVGSLILVIGSSAQAEPQRQLAAPAPAPARATTSATQPQGRALALPYTQRNFSVRAPGVAQTSIDRQFEGGVAGSAGFICGRPDNPYVAGSAAAHGSDPNGRFLGASLRISFR